MPRPKKPGAPEPKRRSRNGCWPCKNRKIKCGEEHPSCLNCQKVGEPCDYSIRLNWDGRRGKRPEPESGDSNPDLPSPAVPAKGFKLVHQFPSSTTASGSRRLEPLTPSAGASTGDTTPSASTAAAEASGTPPQSSSDIVRARPAKRVKLSTDAETQDPAEKKPCSSPSSTGDPGSVPFRFAVPSISSAGSPVTPATPSAYSDDDRRHAHTPRADRWPVPSPDIRRMSVHSLLSGPPGPQGPHEEYTSPSSMHSGSVDTHLSYYSSQPRYYGTDRGLPDLDLGKNDDNNAISLAVSPASQCASLATPSGESDYSDQLFPNEFGFGVETNDMTEDAGGYYDKPVQIFIPPHLEPLPPKLLHNPMNLLYFHHFINHTARVLVPYDDPQANPFRTTLPQIAVKNDDLLALVLAYSASHRARVLKHPEPQLRIATWVTDIFPTLRQALSDPQKNFSDANLASAIMLASLEIVSPKVFGYEIPWQKHLSLARELITARPGGLHYQTNFRQDNVCSFLWSWAAYMDVISSLTGGPKDSSTAWMFDYEVEDRSDGYDEIDCIMGFTTRCLYLLAKIADLARLCDAERLRAGCGAVNQWAPSKDQLDQGLKLEKDIKDSMKQAPRPCKHIHTSANLDKWNRVELMATNEAFHWAGLVHIYRRILGRPSEDEDVQTAVSKTIACFDNIRRGGTAEQSLLFPMFTAGCDAREESQRNFLLERFEAGKAHGMTQVRKARKLMMKVWETGQPWETLLSTEFIG